MHATTYEILAREHIQAMQRAAQADLATSTIRGDGRPSILVLIGHVRAVPRLLVTWLSAI